MGSRQSVARRLGIGAIIVATAVALAAPSHAQQPRHAKRQSDTAVIDKLQKEIRQRDALIRNLLSRVERLERHDGLRAAAGRTGAAAAGATAAAASPAGAPAAPAPVAPSTRQVAAAAPAASPAAPAAPAAAAAAPAQPAAPAPGQFTVSPEAAQHALERALEQSGALLLQSGKFQFVPSVTFQYQEASFPDTLALPPVPPLVSQFRVRAEAVQAQALFRAGLPWDSQLEIGLPYGFKSRSITTQVLNNPIAEQIADAVGLGDPTLTLTKQIAKEKEWLPNLFLSGGWNVDLGQTSKGLPLGLGFNEFRAGLLASKRQDPLVFTGGFTYQTSLEKNGITPGDQFIPSAGMLFAVSPETSLQFNQQVAFVQSTRFQGANVPGSTQLQGTFTAGILSILAPGVVVQFLAGIGETPDAPALTLELALPINLN